MVVPKKLLTDHSDQPNRISQQNSPYNIVGDKVPVHINIPHNIKNMNVKDDKNLISTNPTQTPSKIADNKDYTFYKVQKGIN